MSNTQSGLDWDKNKTFQIKRRGNLSLLAASTIKDGNLVSTNQRCIWPSQFSSNNNDKIISRRVWGKLG